MKNGNSIEMAIRGSVFPILGFAGWAQNDFRPDMWAVFGFSFLLGLVIFLFGVIADMRKPKKMEVLLRHGGEAWLLDVMAHADGTISAPRDEGGRIMRSVNIHEVSENILGAPKFEPFTEWVRRCSGFILLGERYCRPQDYYTASK